jgi:hypothetical protein
MQFFSSVSQFQRFGCFALSALALAVASGCTSKQLAPPAPAAQPTTVLTTPAAVASPAVAVSAPAQPAAPKPVSPPVSAPITTPVAVAAPAPVTLKAEAGLMRCEDGVTVAVKRVIDNGAKISAAMRGGKDIEMTQVSTESGALRYESKSANLALIYVVGRVFMLDTKRGSRIANDCKL